MSQSAEWRYGRSWMVRKSQNDTVWVVAAPMHFYLWLETQWKRVEDELRFRRGWTFIPDDCGDEVKELCELVHFICPAPRCEHVMS